MNAYTDKMIKDNKERCINPRVKAHLDAALNLLTTQHPELIEFYHDLYFAGGCIRSIVAGEQPKDYDIFLDTDEALENIEKICKDNNIGHRTFNSITIQVKELEFQIILVEAFPAMEEIASFDFTMNMNYYVPVNGDIWIEDVEAIKNKHLKVNFKCRNPFDTFFRVHKFMNRGFTVHCEDDLRKLAVMLTRLKPIDSKEDFVESTRMCGSAMLEEGNLEFLK